VGLRSSVEGIERMTHSDSTSPPQALSWIVVAVLGGAAAAGALHLTTRGAEPAREPISIGPQLGTGGPPTSAEGLRQRIDDMERRLREQPHDAGAAVLLADALLRQARATNDGRPANHAAEVLKAVLKEVPSHYDALRMLGAVYLSQHRFREAPGARETSVRATRGTTG
jgi:cytochrome c-type biogenesis protein CcmH/NrfG